MSMLLMAKAMGIKVGNPLRKLVLLKLADNANDEGVCFPSYQYIATVCEISKRSAMNHIEALINMGLVCKKNRKNKDGSCSNLYQLQLDNAPPLGGAGNSQGSAGDSLGSAGDSLGGSAGDSPRTSHIINQSLNHKKIYIKKSENSAISLLAEFGITDQLAKDFLTHRKAKNAPITKTALERLQKQADLARLPLAEVAEIMIDEGWRGFKAEWLENKQAPQANKQARSGKDLSAFSDDDDSWWRGQVIEVRGY